MEYGRFGEMVRQAREEKGLKAFELADLMHMHGSQISRLENGTFKGTPAPDVLRQLQALLGLDEVEMLRAVGYLQDEPAPVLDDDPDRLRDQMVVAARKVRWREKPEMARSIIATINAVLHDQEPAQTERSGASLESSR